MLKTLQARLQQYMNQELPDVQAGFRKSRGTRDQIANRIIEKAREFQKNIYFCSTEAFVWSIKTCGKFLKRWQYQTTLPASWETCMQVKKQLLELDMEHVDNGMDMEQWIQIQKGVCQDCILSPGWIYF